MKFFFVGSIPILLGKMVGNLKEIDVNVTKIRLQLIETHMVSLCISLGGRDLPLLMSLGEEETLLQFSIDRQYI